MRESLRAGGITTETITEALMSARGDLFVAASILGCTGRELDSYIRASEDLQAFSTAIGTVKAGADYKRLSDEQFSDQLENLTKGYRLEALDVIHDLAMMPFDTAAMAEVKLKAAVALRGAPEVRSGAGDQSAVLAELNELYVQSAPRIRSVRIAQIEYQS